jgi:hypothetical protein
MGEISQSVRARVGNYLVKPFRSRNDDIIKFSKAFLDYCVGKEKEKRVINLLQAVVRNPILGQRYGRNSPATIRIKGFNRLLIDTAQFFRAIQAKVINIRKR